MIGSIWEIQYILNKSSRGLIIMTMPLFMIQLAGNHKNDISEILK